MSVNYKELLNSEITQDHVDNFKRLIYQLGQGIRTNEKSFVYANVKTNDSQAIFYNNVISLRVDVAGKAVGVDIHFDDLPSIQKEYLNACIAMWLVETEDLVEAPEVAEA